MSIYVQNPFHSLSVEDNFRTPNFELVADILDWLLHRFEPGIAIPDDISTESHRVHFIKSVVECPGHLCISSYIHIA